VERPARGQHSCGRSAVRLWGQELVASILVRSLPALDRIGSLPGHHALSHSPWGKNLGRVEATKLSKFGKKK